MRNSDIDTMKKVMLALETYLPPSEKALLDEYSEVFERFNSKNDKEKAAYQDKAEYYRDYTRSWQKNNPEKRKEHGKRYQAKKQQAKQKANGSTDNPPSLHEKLEKNKERAKTQAGTITQTQKPPRKNKETR